MVGGDQSSRRRPNVTSSSGKLPRPSASLLFSTNINANGTCTSSTTSSSTITLPCTSSATSPHSTTASSSLLKDDYASDHALFRTNSSKTFKPARRGIIVHPILSLAFVGCTITLLGLWFVFLGHVIEHRREYHVHFFHGLKWQQQHSRLQQQQLQQQPNPTHNKNRKGSSNPYCQFRRYPSHRYYQLTRHEPQPAFLTTETEYIFGEWPVLLPPPEHGHKDYAPPITKLCVDQSEWLPSSSSVSHQVRIWPFADGTNPSILTLHRLQHRAPTVALEILHAFPTAHVLVTLCMTNSQCTWRDTEAMRDQHCDLPNLQQTEPDTVRTILQILDEDYQVLTATTIVLHRDAAWGKQFPQPAVDHHHNIQMHRPALDDARLFVHAQQIMVSYREGLGFGYETQVLNPVHLEFSLGAAANTPLMTATLRASETMSVCCGRNMALMNVPAVPETNDAHADASPQQLFALTWVDPMTVEPVDTTPLVQQRRQPRSRPNPKQRRRLMTESQFGAEDHEKDAMAADAHRGLKEQRHPPSLRKTVHKSHIHGTNAFMLPLPTTASGKMEYLGVAHFHRPNDRKPNPYSRFGHHYTHAFYRVERQHPPDGSANSQWHLTGLSPEFVLPSAVPAQRDDAEVIQFVSGLELLGDGTTLVLAYGINDCEAALTTLSLPMVLGMLRDIQRGTQVVDYMQPLSFSTQ